MALLKVALPFLLLALAVNVDGNVISGGGLGVRAAQTSALCLGDFDWMSNSNGEAPCLVAAKVLGSCAGGNWNVPSLSTDNSTGISTKYDNPNSTTANPCSCSWTAYNLLSACTACQGIPTSVQNWTPYKLGCSAGDLSDTYFPTSIVLPTGTLIPAYAAQDPTAWPNQKFDVNAARTIASKEEPDLSQPAPKKKKAPVGAIVGGVVGGVAIVVLAIGIVLFMIRRQRQSRTRRNVSRTPAGKPAHIRQISDQSSKSGFIGIGYAPSQGAPLSPTTLHTHNSSISSFSQLGLSTAPLVPPRPFASPSPSMQNTSRENIVVPFNLQPLSAIPESPRKGAKGPGVYQVYDSPNARPIPHEDSLETSTPPRARVNPPTYNESTSGSPSSGHRRIHSKSSDSNHSYETSPGSVATWMSGHPAGTASISGIGEVMSQVDMDLMSNANQSSSAAAGPSRKFTPPTGDRKRRPEDN